MSVHKLLFRNNHLVTPCSTHVWKRARSYQVSPIIILTFLHWWKYIHLMTNTFVWRHINYVQTCISAFFTTAFQLLRLQQLVTLGHTFTLHCMGSIQEAFTRGIYKKQFLLTTDQVLCSERWIQDFCLPILSLWSYKHPQMCEFMQLISKRFCVLARMVTRNSLYTVRVTTELQDRSWLLWWLTLKIEKVNRSRALKKKWWSNSEISVYFVWILSLANSLKKSPVSAALKKK